MTESEAETRREILSRLIQGEREIAQGEGHDLEDVLNEADSLLRPSSAPLRGEPSLPNPSLPASPPSRRERGA